ncbi:MAG TPA: glycosyltransferase [Prosthecobacter sp.]
MRPALLLIGHTYAALENRKKIQALARHFDLVCVTSTLEDRVILGRRATDFDNDSDEAFRGYQLVRLRRSGTNETTFRYAGLADVMRSRRFDVVLVENEPWAVVRWQARFWKSLVQPQALFGEFTWENVERPGWKGCALAPIYRAMTATTDFIIAGNQAAAQLVQKRGAKADAVCVSPQLGVDLSNHQPASGEERDALRKASGLPSGAFVVGYCGRLVEEKGIKELVEACGEVGTVHLALLGSGALEPWLREQAKSRPWIHLLPPRPHGEIPAFLRCLDVFVLASKPVRTSQLCWEEQFGHVLIEAMACGVATLGSSSGAIPEVVGDEAAVFPFGDAKALAARLREAMHDPALADRQLQRTRAWYTHDAVAAQWAGFIQQRLAA